MPAGSKLGLLGASMGGAVSIMVGHSDSLKLAPVGIATDCAFCSLYDTVMFKCDRVLHSPPPPPPPAAASWAATRALMHSVLHSRGSTRHGARE